MVNVIQLLATALDPKLVILGFVGFRFPCNPPPPPKLAKKSQQIGEQIGGPIFRQNRLPVPWISVPDP